MALFKGSQEKRDRKALDHFLAAQSIDAGEIDELQRECHDAAGHLHAVLVESQNAHHRFRALLGLQQLGITEAMVPGVVAALHDEDEFVQESAARILRTYRDLPQQVVPAVLAQYGEHRGNRITLLEILEGYGPAAAPLGVARAIRGGLAIPVEAIATARCLTAIGLDELTDVERSMVDVLCDRADTAALKASGPPVVAACEKFLLSCVPWRYVDAIPAWRRVLEAYAGIVDRPADSLKPVLAELAEFSDWKLRGEVSAQFVEMSRAKAIAGALIKRATV